MKSSFASIGRLAALLLAGTAAAVAAPPAVDCLAKLQSLVGDWSGTAKDEDSGGPVRVSYRLTGAGSVVVENLFPGTPHEMMTVYHLDGDRLMLTHYCAAKNQPRMVLDPASTTGEFIFTFAGGTNLTPGQGTYMSGARIRFVDADTIESAWELLSDGKPAGTKRFFLKRVKPPS